MKLYLFLFVLFTSMLYPSLVEARGHRGKSGYTKKYKSKKSYSFKKSFKKGYRAGSKIFKIKHTKIPKTKSRKSPPVSHYKAPKPLSIYKHTQRDRAAPRGSYSPYGPKTRGVGLGIKQAPVLLGQEAPKVLIRNPNYNKHMLRIEASTLETSAVSVSQYMSWQEWFLFGTKEIERRLYDITY